MLISERWLLPIGSVSDGARLRHSVAGSNPRLPVEERQCELELSECVQVVFVGAHRLARRSNVVVREEVRERRMPDDVLNESGQKLRH